MKFVERVVHIVLATIWRARPQGPGRGPRSLSRVLSLGLLLGAVPGLAAAQSPARLSASLPATLPAASASTPASFAAPAATPSSSVPGSRSPTQAAAASAPVPRVPPPPPALAPGAAELATQAWLGFQQGDPAPATAALPALRGTLLEPWIAYWALEPRLHTSTQQDIDTFAKAWPDSLPLQRLRSQWLFELARRKDWAGYLGAYAAYDGDNAQLQCLQAQARFETAADNTAPKVLALWSQEPSGGTGCDSAAKALLGAGLIGEEALWGRLRGFFADGRARAALPFLSSLPDPQAKGVRRAVDDPLGVMLDAARSGVPTDTVQRRVLVLALFNMAHQDPQQTMRLLGGSLRGLRADLRAAIAWRAARAASVQLLPGAAELFRQALRIDPAWQADPESWKWCLRAALRESRWGLVKQATQALLRDGKAGDLAEATYWRAVALNATGESRKARELWRGLAEPWSYYGQLATEALGRPVRVPEQAPMPPDMRLVYAQAARDPVREALLLYRVQAYAPAAWQWRAALDGAGDAQWHAAAQLACDQRAWLLCISASERMQGSVDWAQRYVMPFRAQVAQASRSTGVSEAFVYGIMRQESRFAAGIRSWAGADGLMQLMPATARWVARKTGMDGFQAGQVNDVGTNVTLGAAYLGMLLQRFDGSQAMAAAGYNAGPGRPARWRGMPLPDQQALDGAVFTESIPVEQTRDYVKRVLANATVYSALLGGDPQSLESRLALAAPTRISATQPMP
ncbi:lytic transglycosylase domain-containing protein [Thiomonas sp. FB-6]|uniref:lytic transglycosylase domain-containing protein n=1 Tax=Thiomonas sp. FB-6 TaxID=1158291 RepID=UPI00039D441C|nr:lytic transglycosylase domain-containing protein [Thiomonas sp. FB-6]